MSIVTLALVVAVVLGLIEWFRSHLESLTALAVVIGFGALLVGRLG